ncbi:MAG: hypothetical protein H7Y38_00470 [Armatimonadetes bacterium]|nr:hypothetical protein [Armatimonadota bacterium]
MFDTNEITRIVGLQSKSYTLLKWFGENVGAGGFSFTVSHGASSVGEAATEWLLRNAHSLPADSRPDENDWNEFGCLFASYLTTSFTLVEDAAPTYRSRTGCYCVFCRRLRSVSALRVRTPDKKAGGKAMEMKRLYVSGLAAEQDTPLAGDALTALLADRDLAPAVSYATYGQELIRRSRFVSQGEGVLVLWREIAWINGKLNKRFALSADAILASEKTVAAAIIAAA